MATGQSIQDRRPTPGLAMNFSSNNPFRRAASPQNLSPTSPSITGVAAGNSSPHIQPPPPPPPPPPANSRRSPRPVSTNPFLDTYQTQNMPPPAAPARRSGSPTKQAGSSVQNYQDSKLGKDGPTVGVTELLGDLNLSGKSPINTSPNPQSSTSQTRKGENMHLLVNGNYARPPRSETHPLKHRPMRSEEDRYVRPPGEAAGNRGELDIFASPGKNENRRPAVRRNSESSVMDVKGEDRKEREQRHQERDRRHKERRPRKPNRQVDIIDKLDVTGLYGPGLFHHDGPFDACNPSRNRKGRRPAPMEAFALDSANNVLGGSGPLNKGPDYERIHGRGAEGFSDYNDTRHSDDKPRPVKRPPVVERAHSYNTAGNGNNVQAPKPFSDFHAAKTVDEVHGDASAGLGTSTFLEGTPVSRRDLQRQQYEAEQQAAMAASGASAGGLQRKRSIAQKIRGGINRPRHGSSADQGGRVNSPEARYEYSQNGERPMSPNSPRFPPAAYGMHGTFQEVKPLDETRPAPPKKRSTAGVAAHPAGSSSVAEGSGRVRTGSSPTRVPARAVTYENGIGGSEGANEGPKMNGGSSGLLGRMKSLKGKKARPERFGGSG